MSADQDNSTLPLSAAFDQFSIYSQASRPSINQSTFHGNTHSPSHIASHIPLSSLATDQMKMDARNKFNPSSLLSPDQMPYESFNRRSPEPTHFVDMKPKSMAISQILLSPPVSPQTKLVQPHERTIATEDPILYSPERSTSQDLETPLFPPVEDVDPEIVVDAHISARAQRKKQFRELPPRDDYVLALEFKSQVHKLWAQDQRKWHARELAYLKEDERIRSAERARHALVKIAPAQNQKTTPSPIRKKPAAPKAPRAPKTPRTSVVGRVSATPEPSKSGHVRNTTHTTREDRDFASLPNYAPPNSTLPSRSNSMKVDWKGAPIDLSLDKELHLLHPDEASLAANLRLDCATYLTSKRRVFIGVVAKYREGGEFKKTHCQQACKIDVNKASKLWEAYKKVDWFNPKYFDQYL